ncbi:MAG: hypothetical protein M1832_005855 [Thelocarpon impressellum]|nr:MAG: hypothetical protein M1832_005855 [Thelocarpon impressellum]
MPTKRWMDKKSSTTYRLVHREQTDPLIHDSEAPSQVFQEVIPSNKKVRFEKLTFSTPPDDGAALEASAGRENEGEAANHGIFFDDSAYDYMQHMREIGKIPGATLVDAASTSPVPKGKRKQKLEDALREACLEDKVAGIDEDAQTPLLDQAVLPSTNLKQYNHQDQQNVPDALGGFQPDMDPRLREALEALEDDAYVDEEDDVFGELAKDGEEISFDEFALAGLDEDDGWASDDTAKPDLDARMADVGSKSAADGDARMADVASRGAADGEGDWIAEYGKFKTATKARPLAPTLSKTGSSSLTGQRRKKRKGAMTSASTYSMSSATTNRTEGQKLLDSRFEKIMEEYAREDDDDFESDARSLAASSTASTGPKSYPANFDSMMDDFLGSYSVVGKKKRRVVNLKPQSGMEQLDEIRKELGPARVRPKPGP